MNILERFSLKGKTAIITGGERGIGFAIALGFAQAGADIAIAGVDVMSADSALVKLRAEGVQAIFVKTDCTDEDQVIAMVNEVKNHFGHIDVLCNNVGISKHAPAEEMPLEMWQRVINTNLTTQFLVSREVGKVMLKQGKGSIVNISSMSGLIVNTPIEQCNYNASKAGVIQLTKSLACEWAKRGVRVNTIAPAYIWTPITAHRFENPDDPYVPTWRAMTPMGREGRPDELCGAALYFASDASTYTTGSVLTVDGGYTCW